MVVEHPSDPAQMGPGAAREVYLPPRERVALVSIAIGLTHDSAAKRLRISNRTLRRTLASAVTRLGAYSVAHAAALALIAGQIDDELVLTRTLPSWPAGSECAAERDWKRTEFVRLYNTGMTLAQAARIAGIARTTARRHLAAVREAQSGGRSSGGGR